MNNDGHAAPYERVGPVNLEQVSSGSRVNKKPAAVPRTEAPAPAPITMAALGSRLRSTREARGWSVRELARRLGCSPGHVSQVERGLVEPSVSLLIAIVTHLELSMEAVFGPDVPLEDGQHATETPPRTRLLIGREERRRIYMRSGVTAELLLPAPEDGFDFCEYIYAPSSASAEDGALIRHPGREYGVVLEGILRIQIVFEEFALKTGDSIAFDSGLPHRFWNDSPKPTRAIWATLRH